MTQITLSEIQKYDLKKELSEKQELRILITHKQARRIQKDWDKYGAYKLAYARNQTRKGLFLSFFWMLRNIVTSILFGDLDRVSGIYYDYGHRLQPVEFLDTKEGSICVIFRVAEPSERIIH